MPDQPQPQPQPVPLPGEARPISDAARAALHTLPTAHAVAIMEEMLSRSAHGNNTVNNSRTRAAE